MLQVVLRDQRFVLILATTVFFTIWTKLSSLRFLFCSSAKIKGFKLSRKYLNIISSVGAPIGLYSNKINYRYLRKVAQSNTDFCWYWETCLNWLQILLIIAQSSPRFIRKKSLNFAYVIGFLASEQHLYWCYCWTTDPRKNEVAKEICLSPLALIVWK